MNRIPVVQFGIGNVGSALVNQVIENRAQHAERLGLRLEYMAVVDSDGAVVSSDGLDDAELAEILSEKANGRRLRELDFGYAQGDPTAIVDVAGADDAIVVDVTATESTIPALLGSLERGYRVVTANKLPMTKSLALFQRLTSGRQIHYETTVGAAMPVISTLQTLVDVGDEVQHIQGCLSGTLGFICSQLEAGEPFADALREAKRMGYTEPDPREDLAGADAARKMLIMARILGRAVEFEDVEIEPLYPDEMNALSIDEFLAEADMLNEKYAMLATEAREAGHALRYVGEVDDEGCRVSLSLVEPEDKLASIKPSDSIVVFQTARYEANPLSISGRGAGPAITAAGVLGDILSF